MRSPEEVDSDGVPASISGKPADGIRPADPIWVRDFVAHQVDSTGPFFWEYDGVPLTEEELNKHRVDHTFNGIIPDDFFDVPPGEWPLSATSGLWFMHQPFEQGEQHTIGLGGIQPDGTRFPSLSIRLSAVPEPNSLLAIVSGAVALLARRTRQKTG